MTVAAILKQKGREVVSVAPTMRADELSRLLHARRIGAVLVQDTASQLLGIVSERDIVAAIAVHGAGALSMTAAQLMTRDVTTTSQSASMAEVMTLMTAGRFRHLPVLEKGRVAGVISIGDVVKARITEQQQEVESLLAYVAGAA